MTPLDGLVSSEVLENDVKPIYMQGVAEQAKPWTVPDGLENPYTMLWVTAEKQCIAFYSYTL